MRSSPWPPSHSQPGLILFLGNTNCPKGSIYNALLRPSLEQTSSMSLSSTCLPLSCVCASAQPLPVYHYNQELGSLFLQGNIRASVQHPPPDALSASHTPEPFFWHFVSQKPRNPGVEAVPKSSAQWLMSTGWSEVQKRLWRAPEDHRLVEKQLSSQCKMGKLSKSWWKQKHSRERWVDSSP